MTAQSKSAALGLALIGLAALCGCRAAQLHRDQEDFRARLQQMYTDQIMDNLILCYNGLPFVQVDYSKITGTVTQQANANVHETQNVLNTRNFGPTLLLTSAVRAITTFYEFTIAAQQQNQLTVTADPITTQPSVYRAYLEYLSKGGRLVESPEPPPPGAALICRMYCGRHYWVPIENREEFRELSLRVVGLRGEASEAPAFFEVTLSGVVAQKTGPEKRDPVTNVPISRPVDLTIRFSPKVPLDSGKLELPLNGRLFTFIFEPGKDSAEEKAKMDTLLLSYIYDYRPFEALTQEDLDEGHIPLSPDEFAEAIKNLAVKLQLNSHRPAISSTKDLLKSIEQELQLLRLQQTGRL